MRLKAAEMEGETLSTASVDAQDRRMARMRERRCVMDESEQRLYEYEPNEARTNKRPGYPCEE